jgi:hypothetical protein
MTFEELRADAVERNADFRQYDRKLAEANCSVREAKKRKSCRGQIWFEKGENVLIIGRPELRSDLSRTHEPQLFVTIWSRSARSFCLAPEDCFR